MFQLALELQCRSSRVATTVS